MWCWWRNSFYLALVESICVGLALHSHSLPLSSWGTRDIDTSATSARLYSLPHTCILFRVSIWLSAHSNISSIWIWKRRQKVSGFLIGHTKQHCTMHSMQTDHWYLCASSSLYIHSGQMIAIIKSPMAPMAVIIHNRIEHNEWQRTSRDRRGRQAPSYWLTHTQTDRLTHPSALDEYDSRLYCIHIFDLFTYIFMRIYSQVRCNSHVMPFVQDYSQETRLRTHCTQYTVRHH